MFRVFSINKSNRQRVDVIASELTEQEAENFCEAWGWNYSNENGESFYIDYEEEDYSINDFLIASNCDTLLFFCTGYQRAVKKAINDIMSQDKSVQKNKKFTLVCRPTTIEIKDKRVNPTFAKCALLDDYDGTIDKESFTGFE